MVVSLRLQLKMWRKFLIQLPLSIGIAGLPVIGNRD